MKSLPNYLTLLRVFAIPLLVLVFINEAWGSLYYPHIVFVIFFVASLTDFFDGYIARKYNVESKFGAMMDPIADKLMVVTLLVYLLVNDMADFLPVLIIILRELLVSGYREFIASNNGEMPVTKLAKWKTTFQFLAIAALLFVPLTAADSQGEVAVVGQMMLWFAAILTFITGWQYTAHSIKFTKDIS